MSRIHDALQKAQREGRAQPLGVRRTAYAASPPGPAAHAAAVQPPRMLPERALREVQLSPRARAALSRSFASIERCVGLERGLVIGSRPACSVAVVGLHPGADAAIAALALAAAVVEKTKARTLVVEADPEGREIAAMFAAHPVSPGFWDLAAQGGEPLAGLLRTGLARLYLMSSGSLSADGAAGPGPGAVLNALREYFPYVVLHAGRRPEGARTERLAGIVDALLLVGGDPSGALPAPAARLAGERSAQVIEALV